MMCRISGALLALIGSREPALYHPYVSENGIIILAHAARGTCVVGTMVTEVNQFVLDIQRAEHNR